MEEANMDNTMKLVTLVMRAFDFLTLQEILSFFTHSKRLREIYEKHIPISIYLLSRFYLKTEWVHPNNKIFFTTLINRLDTQEENISNLNRTIYLKAKRRATININIIKSDMMDTTSIEDWRIMSKGGDGWGFPITLKCPHRNYCLAASSGYCQIDYRVSFDDLDYIIENYKDLFHEDRIIIRCGVWIARRWDCEAEGGFDMSIEDGGGKRFFGKTTRRGYEGMEDFLGDSKYISARHTINYSEIKDLPDRSNLWLRISLYGKDKRGWKGYYGPRFYGPFIAFDYGEEEFKF